MAIHHPSHTFNKFSVDFFGATNLLQGKGKEKVQNKPKVQHKWKPPSYGRYKLNTDASYKEARAAGGGVIRREDGSWVAGFAVKLRATNALEAELLSLRFGLLLSKTLNIKGLDAEVDAKEIKNLLDGKKDICNHKLAPVLKDIACILEENNDLELMHSHRDGNMLAHALADFGMRMRRKRVIHDLPPTSVDHIYEEDLKNLGTHN